ncbi:hypothetical protein [Yinghuangia sp. YIM S09857]|uniref:hypothetical protein n=1 Tax=Yinghuangia sp. YIM S09857 TaxID=3436929 RepID=UPI003F53A762
MTRRTPVEQAAAAKDQVREKSAKAAASVVAATDRAVHAAKEHTPEQVRATAGQVGHQVAGTASALAAKARENTPEPVADTARQAAGAARSRRMQVAVAAVVVTAVVVYRAKSRR